MLTNSEDIGMISVIKLASNRLTAGDLGAMQQAVGHLLERGRLTFLLDLAGVRRITRSGLAALVEWQSALPRGTQMGLFGARPHVAGEIRRCPLASLLNYQDTKKQALAAPGVRDMRLAGMKAVVLCAGAGSRMRPLSLSTPKPMLDFLGKPVLARILDHLGRFGVRDFLLNPGHHGPEIHSAFPSSPKRSVQFANEGEMRGGRWVAQPLGSATTLMRLHRRQTAFDSDFLVVCGDGLTDLDVADMADMHRRSGAVATIACASVPRKDTAKYGVVATDPGGRVVAFHEKPRPEEAPSTLVSTGIYVFSPAALRDLPDRDGLDIAKDLLPALLAKGGHVQAYQGRFSWADLGSVPDYVRALEQAMRGEMSGCVPSGALNRNGVWVSPTAQVSRRAVVVGPCYIAPDAVIEAGAHVEGATVIGAGARICARTVITNTLVMPHTMIGSGIWVDRMVVSPEWAVDHGVAQSLAPNAPLEGVQAVPPAEDAGLAQRCQQALMGRV